MPDRRLLIVDDDPALACRISRCLDGIATFVAANARDAEAILRKEEPQVVILELALSSGSGPEDASVGLALLETVGELLPHTKAIVHTRCDTRAHAVRAVAAGAYDVHYKPADPRMLGFVVDRAFRLVELETEGCRARQADLVSLEALIACPATASGFTTQLARLAASDAPIALRGEPGTCKNLVGLAIHRMSPRSAGPFVGVACGEFRASTPPGDASDLDQGPYPNLADVKLGEIASASGGTLLLENVDEAPPALQRRMLKLLTRMSAYDRGGAESPAAPMRIITTSRRDLSTMMVERSFGTELFAAVAAAAIQVPPLRDRVSEIVALAKALLARHMGQRNLQFSKACMAAMETWPWPGNIRELDSRIRRACMTAAGRFITPRELGIAPDEEEAPLNLKMVRTGAERHAIQRALNRSNHNVSQAARLLGISRPTLYNLFSRHGLRVREPS